MNRNQTLFAVAALATAIAAWQMWEARLTNPAATTADSQAVAIPADPLRTIAEPEAEAEAVSSTSPPADEKSAASVSQETEVVEGFTVLKDRNCRVEVNYITDAETGEVHRAMHCEPRFPPEPDPYESWDEQTLAAMAYGDAHAAAVLGLRHIQSEDPHTEALGLSLLYRAVALSGEPEVFHRAIAARYAYLSVNGEPQVHNLRQLLMFSVIGETLGDNRFRSAGIERDLLNADVPPAEIARIRAGAATVLEGMADLQTDLTGDATIREALENA